ncbi:MAG: hypothetical protein ACTHL8_16550 [Burkholderiaceae bacterium]
MTTSVDLPAIAPPRASEPGFMRAAARERAAARIPTWAGLVLIAALWLVVRPYRGVRHDAILYLGQTLSRLMPDTIGRDIFLAYGSQDRYSIFSTVMAPLVQHLGVGSSQVLVLFSLDALFLLACWKLTAELPSRFVRWCAMLSLVVVSHIYGSGGLLAFAEPFLTARAMCEPFVVIALALVLRGRTAWAAACLALAAAIHPLITLPALASCWLYYVLEDRRWLWALLAVVAAAAAGAAGVAPFDALWHRYDPQWWAAVRTWNSSAFISNSTMLDWAPTLFDAGVVALAGRRLAGSPMARLTRAVLLCTAIFVVLWGVGSDLLANVLATQLQLWRVLWLLHLLALLLLPVVLVDLWDRGAVGRWAFSAVVFAGIAVTGNIGAGWLCLAWAALALEALRRGTRLSPGIVRLAAIGSVAGTLVVTSVMFRETYALVEIATSRFRSIGLAQIVLGLTVFGAAFGLLLLRGLGATGLRRGLAFAALAGLVAQASVAWDQRSDWQRFVENGLQETQLPFAGRLPPTAKVYWDDSLLDAWMLTHRPDYYAPEQGAGLLFNRATTVAYLARKRVVAPLEAKREICQTVAGLMGKDLSDPDTCGPTEDDVRKLCATPGGPDLVVIHAGFAGQPLGATATWAFAPDDPKRRRVYRLYDCSALK